MPLVTLFAHLI